MGNPCTKDTALSPDTQSDSPCGNDIENAKRVLLAGAEALQDLAQSLDQNFVDAVTVINDMKLQRGLNGRLIIAGIGKSGHIARKLAATLASTGTPSYFVHPGEASHGDLGMVTDNDIVLILSNSGENTELSDLIHYTRRYNIKLIAMTSNAQSTLAKHADIVLLLPKKPEACPNGLAPTTSTTMMISLGDALAVALLERMGLTPEQFKKFHPGGKLGKQLQKTADLMVPYDELPFISETAKMDEAIIVLTEKNVGVVLIMDDNKDLKGIITDGDLKRHMSPELLTKSVRDIMSTSPQTIDSQTLAAVAVNIMTKTPERYLTSLVVTENDKLTGLIRLQDCLQAGIA